MWRLQGQGRPNTGFAVVADEVRNLNKTRRCNLADLIEGTPENKNKDLIL